MSISLTTLIRRWFIALVVFRLAMQPALAGVLTGQIGSHDPSRIIDCYGVCYVYSTGGRMEHSTDLINWAGGPSPFAAAPTSSATPASMTGAGPSPGGAGGRFRRTMAPASVQKLFAPGQSQGIWAPDVIYLNKKYYMYYCVAARDGSFTAVGLITSPTLNPDDPAYHWTDEGPVITDKDHQDLKSAMDPCPFLDTNGDLWLSYGSGFANGAKQNDPTIFLTKLDKNTGLPDSTDKTQYPVAYGHIEASYVFYHDGYYYLFWNSGGCCNGAKSSYTIHMARARNLTGPYVNKSGQQRASEIFLGPTVYKNSIIGNEHGPGQIGVLSEDGLDRCTYHFYGDNGRPVLGEETMVWGADGWPSAGTDLAPGTYKITSNAGGGMALGLPAAGGLLQGQSYSGDKSQQWKVAYTYSSGTNADGYYSITSVSTGQPLDLAQLGAPNTSPMTQATTPPGGTQRWVIEQTGDGSYRIVSAVNWQAVSVPQAGGAALSMVKPGSMGDPRVIEWNFGAP